MIVSILEVLMIRVVPTPNGFSLVANSAKDRKQLNIFFLRRGTEYLLLTGEQEGHDVAKVDFVVKVPSR